MKTIQLIAFLLFVSISLDAQDPRTVQSNTDLHNAEVKRGLLETNQSLQQDLATMESSILNLSKLNDELESITNAYSESLMNLIEQNLKPSISQTDLTANLKEMKELHQSYSRQCLALQDSMNKQAQLMQMMSNILKNHHDAEKNIINNIK